MSMLRALLVAVALGATSARAQDSTPLTAAALEGAWVRTGNIPANGPEGPSEPGIRTFAGGHYSWMTASADRPLVQPAAATAEQLREILGLTAQSGRYEVSGHTMTQHPVVTLNPNLMRDPDYRQIFAVRLVADTMWLTQVWNTPTGPLTNQATGKYVRVRSGSASTN